MKKREEGTCISSRDFASEGTERKNIVATFGRGKIGSVGSTLKEMRKRNRDNRANSIGITKRRGKCPPTGDKKSIE